MKSPVSTCGVNSGLCLYVTPLYGGCLPSRDFPRIFDLHASGQLMLDELVTRTYRLEELAEAFDDLLAGRLAKGVITFGN